MSARLLHTKLGRAKFLGPLYIALEDTWHWNIGAERIYSELLTDANPEVGSVISSLRGFIGTNQMMAYLVMMTVRLVELHRVLKPNGSIYLHCDPTASHYIKIILDVIFDKKNFRNDIIWHYSGWNKKLKDHFEKRTDNILFYSKGAHPLFHGYTRPQANAEEYVKVRKQKLHKEENGREYVLSDAGGGKRIMRYIEDALKTGTYIDNCWDIDKLNNSSKEKLGYPTQKLLALLERIYPFCGCGTAIAAAQKLGRRWIGIDITQLSIALQKYRLEAMFPGILFNVKGEPTVIADAIQLAKDDRYQFQWWALSLICARPLGGKADSREGKKGSDRGIDGVIPFIDELGGKQKRVIVQVKSGHVKSGDIRDLKGVLDREEKVAASQAAIGVFITLEPVTREMTREAVSAGFYKSPVWDKEYPRIQIYTIADLLHGAEVQMPPQTSAFRQAPKAQGVGIEQPGLILGDILEDDDPTEEDEV